MIALAVIYVACLAVIAAFVIFGPDHEIKGAPGFLAFLGLFSSGLALAIHALP